MFTMNSDDSRRDTPIFGNTNPFMGIGVPLSAAVNENTLVTDKNSFGKTISRSAIYFALERQFVLDFPKVKAYEEYVDEYINKLVLGPVSDGQNLFLATKYKVDQNIFKIGGGGGSGMSAEDRRNKVATLVARIKNDSSKLGVKLSNDEIAYMATAAQKLDFSEDQLTDMIVNQIDWKEVQAGTLTATRDQVKVLGKKYLMNLSDQTAQDYSARIASGELDSNAIGSILSAQARSSMPWIAQYLDQGLTPEDVLIPSRDAIAQGLELNAGDVDISNSQYLKMMTVEDPKSGTRLATQSEVAQNVRSDSRWGQTKQAKQMGASMAVSLAEIFGKSAF
jgi:hypothetical protein